ncbi:Os04g0580350 [Oryza sativa Japonica Group]|uniref:Os04g0580350 protein n=1 Tax=Oryza sativa subsp. japonica TaxID=39947 RepID=A0A0P0WDW5_ORYSJ|nr:hypothetical protein EE612_025138 [Oryza sativa]BAS90642.1 Os04g0580350 [Oryza sativa Japonica Group]
MAAAASESSCRDVVAEVGGEQEAEEDAVEVDEFEGDRVIPTATAAISAEVSGETAADAAAVRCLTVRRYSCCCIAICRC